ncbi:hypothetical protein LRH25_29580 [Ideonella azotifigens]|uniref:hypothetical protein n=1 Tax=Ideonella azotifigens TaxID=513160 RepID=UPI0011436B12|nr:hypothetical protein [Ideonella azotifigens]MCD2344481.1 hypothetical protein [Ideonella azotifigens]
MSTPSSSDAEANRPVRRRHVLYLGGFDPQGPAHYHAMYQREAAKQAAVSGYTLTVGPRLRAGAHAATWALSWQNPGGEVCETDYEFLRWDDFVRQHWPKGQAKLIGMTLRTTWRMLANGSLWRMLQTSWPAFLAISAPGLMIVGVTLALLLLFLAAVGLEAATASLWPALALLVFGLPSLFFAARWLQARTQMAWLMRSATVILQQACGQTPDLEARLDEFASRLHQVLSRPDLDEVLVVGHSSGAMLAVSVVARALRMAEATGLPSSSRLSLLTLGQCMPVLSYQPEATAFRAELNTLRRAPELFWLDVTAPPDGCCFALHDPSGICLDGLSTAPEGDLGGAKCVSPRFAQLFSAATYREVKRDKYRCHFQYLMAGERVGFYDFFAITAGGSALDRRFEAAPAVQGFRDLQRFGSPAR